MILYQLTKNFKYFKHRKLLLSSQQFWAGYGIRDPENTYNRSRIRAPRGPKDTRSRIRIRNTDNIPQPFFISSKVHLLGLKFIFLL
jgi:hypothetical protein